MRKLDRRKQEMITLFTENGEITISIEKIRGQQVKIGINAPDSVEVARTKLLDRPSDSGHG